MSKQTKPNAELAELTSKLAEARAHLQQLVEGERQVVQTAFASLQNGGRASEIDRFKNDQLGLLREPLSTARKMVDEIETQIRAIKSAEAASRSKARRSDVAATIESDRSEVEKLRATLKTLTDKRAELDLQLIDARGQRLKMSDDADALVKAQGLALAAGGTFDDDKVKGLRSDAAALADKVRAYEIAVADVDSKIKLARDDLGFAERGLKEMLNVQRMESEAKALAKAIEAFVKAGGKDAKHLAHVVLDAISAAAIPKPDNSWKLDNSHLMTKVGV